MMTPARDRHSMPTISLTVLCWVLLAGAALCVAQQSRPTLQIDSPTSGTILNPGQTITVSVSSPAGASFSQVAVIGQDPIPTSNLQNSVPAQFSITIPTEIDAGSYTLTATGTTTPGQMGDSVPISVDIERPDMPTALSAQTPASQLTLEALGQRFPIILFAAFSDGSILAVTQSSYVTYSSSNTAIATVDNNGMVTAVSAGTATITAT